MLLLLSSWIIMYVCVVMDRNREKRRNDRTKFRGKKTLYPRKGQQNDDDDGSAAFTTVNYRVVVAVVLASEGKTRTGMLQFNKWRKRGALFAVFARLLTLSLSLSDKKFPLGLSGSLRFHPRGKHTFSCARH